MTSYSQVFGGTAIKPADIQYAALTIAANTTLVWPLESVGGANYVAAQMDVTASAISLSLIMPPADEGSTGVATMITNVGSNTFAVKDNGGNVIVSITTGLSWIITLTNNGSVNGSWRAYQLAATTSTANAAALAGLGLQATGANKLQTTVLSSVKSGSYTLLVTDRATEFIYTGGGAGTFQLDTIANLTDGWWCWVTNHGGGVLTISCSGGETINGQASIALPIGIGGQYYSALIACSAAGFNAVGTVPYPTPVAAGGTGATNATSALTNLGGTSVGESIFTAPSVSAVLAILGITGTAFTEITAGSNQVLTTGTGSRAYVCTAALSLTLPHTTLLGTNYYFAAYAKGGAVTITPDAADAINGGSAGVSYVIPQNVSAMFVTDANGNWWPIFTGRAFTIEGNTTVLQAYNGGAPTTGNIPIWDASNNLVDGLIKSGTATHLLSTTGALTSGHFLNINATADAVDSGKTVAGTGTVLVTNTGAAPTNGHFVMWDGNQNAIDNSKVPTGTANTIMSFSGSAAGTNFVALDGSSNGAASAYGPSSFARAATFSGGTALALGQTTFAHGLGITYQGSVRLVIVNNSTDAGYAVGDWVDLATTGPANGSNNTITIYTDAAGNNTSVWVEIGVSIANKGTGALTNLTLAKWTLYIGVTP